MSKDAASVQEGERDSLRLVTVVAAGAMLAALVAFAWLALASA